MANLPTAYASQRFGSKALDFYAAAGEVIGADPRARADERRLQDFDGARHVVRVMEAKFALEPGDQASVLRLQPGPSRRSRPVAVVNHSHKTWTRTHPGANALLSRAGVARNVNWAVTVALFALAALVCVWPYMVAFLAELAPGAFAGLPAFDVFTQAAAALTGLAGWSMAEVSAPIARLLDGLRPGLGGLAPALAYGGAALFGAVVVFAARSWRLLWTPLYVGALGAGAMGFGGAADALAPALSGLAIAAAVFLAGGVWNRISDAMRLESRIALLADHLMTNAPEETVSRSEAPEETAAEVSEDALVDERTAVAVAASLREIGGEDGDTPSSAIDDGQAGDGAPAPEAEISTDASADAADDETRDAEAAETPHGSDAEPHDDARSGAEGAVIEEAAPKTPDPSDETTDEIHGDGAREPTAEEPGEAARPDTLVSAGLDADEAERLRTDPRYASRAILLPPPPPMPAPGRPSEAKPDDAQASDGEPKPERKLETAGASPSGGQARTLNPGKPLPDNVVPFFATPPSRDE